MNENKVNVSDKATKEDIEAGTEGKWVDAKELKDQQDAEELVMLSLSKYYRPYFKDSKEVPDNLINEFNIDSTSFENCYSAIRDGDDIFAVVVETRSKVNSNFLSENAVLVYDLKDNSLKRKIKIPETSTYNGSVYQTFLYFNKQQSLIPKAIIRTKFGRLCAVTYHDGDRSTTTYVIVNLDTGEVMNNQTNNQQAYFAYSNSKIITECDTGFTTHELYSSSSRHYIRINQYTKAGCQSSLSQDYQLKASHRYSMLGLGCANGVSYYLVCLSVSSGDKIELVSYTLSSGLASSRTDLFPEFASVTIDDFQLISYLPSCVVKIHNNLYSFTPPSKFTKLNSDSEYDSSYYLYSLTYMGKVQGKMYFGGGGSSSNKDRWIKYDPDTKKLIKLENTIPQEAQMWIWPDYDDSTNMELKKYPEYSVCAFTLVNFDTMSFIPRKESNADIKLSHAVSDSRLSGYVQDTMGTWLRTALCGTITDFDLPFSACTSKSNAQYYLRSFLKYTQR